MIFATSSKTPKIKFFPYARKSTDEKDRQIMSLDSQTTELRVFGEREKIFIYETIEESKTAKQPGRPRFNEMLGRIERGEANGLLCSCARESKNAESKKNRN